MHLNFFQLRMRYIQLGSHSHGENPSDFQDFCILKHSNELFKQTTKAYNIVCKKEKKNRYGTGVEQINCRLLGAVFVFFFFATFVRALARISTSARKKNTKKKPVFSHLRVPEHSY